MRRFMNQSDEFLRLCLARKQGDLAAVAHAQCRCNPFVELKRDVLLCEKINEPGTLLADFAGDFVLELRQVFALGLRHVLSRDLRPSLCALDGFRL